MRAALDAAADRAEGDSADVLHATAAMAADPSLVEDAEQRVLTDRLVPERAVWEAAEAVAVQFEALGGYFAERTQDIADVRDRLVAHLTGRPAPGVPAHEEPFVLVAADLAPGDRRHPGHGPRARDRHRDRRSHVAHRDPGAGPRDPDGRRRPGSRGGRPRGGPRARGRLRRHGDRRPDGRAGPRRARARGPGPDLRRPRPTSDGHAVALLANVGDPSDAAARSRGRRRGHRAVPHGVRVPRPDRGADDRRAGHGVPAASSAAFPGRKVVIRTLDAGADKPLPFLTDDHEVNPALGVRGLRTSVRHPEVLEDQLTAIARAAEQERADVWVMAPMVSTVDEAEQFVAACAKHGLDVAGVMIEVPPRRCWPARSWPTRRSRASGPTT